MKRSLTPLSVEGFRYAHWILMDYGDVIVHVFQNETRDYYELEKLWIDAPRIPAKGESNSPKSERYHS